MARVETSIRAVSCPCGSLHEIVYSYVAGIGDHRYLCGSEVRTFVDRPFDKNWVKTVTLGVVTLPSSEEPK